MIKDEKFPWSIFRLATAAMFLCLAFVLGLMMVAKAYSLVPGDLWPAIVFLPFIALAYGAAEAFAGKEQEQTNQTFLLWGNPIGWLLLFFIWMIKKSPTACFIALIAYPSVMKEDD